MHGKERTVFIAFIATLMILSGLLVMWVDENRWSVTVTKVFTSSNARHVLRSCVKELGGNAHVETEWNGNIPERWIITCRYRNE